MCVCIYILLKKVDNARLSESDWLTPYQSKDPSPTTPSHRIKEEKGKIVRDKKGVSIKANKKVLALLLKPASPNTIKFIYSGYQDRSTEILTGE